MLQFHKGIPFGLMNVEDLRPNDLQRPARDFPDLNFVIHHLAVPYFDEAVSIAGRFPNVYLSLAANLNFVLIAPRLVQQQVGQLLQMVGSEKLCCASEAPFSGGPAPYLRAFMDMEIPEDLCDGYGYPQITRQRSREHPRPQLCPADGRRRRGDEAEAGGGMNAVEERLESLRPILSAHAGGVELVSITDGVVRIRYTGMCTGLPSAPADHGRNGASRAACPRRSHRGGGRRIAHLGPGRGEACPRVVVLNGMGPRSK